MGVGTRTEVKRAISKGRVSVDGACVKKPETKIDTEETTVVFDGQIVEYTKKEYYMLHKPAGVISATEDAREKTVIDLIVSRKRKDLFPVGRLDKDTEGLLLITNDGELAHRLLSPKKHVDKTYYAKVQGIVTQEDVRKFAEGVDIHEKKLTAPAVLEVVKSGEVSMHGRCNKHSFSKFSGQSKYCVADMPSCRLIQQEILSFSSRNVYLLFTHHIVEYICIHSGSIDDHLCFIHRILCADPISACNPSLNLFHFLIQTKLHAILRRIFCKCDC